MTTTTVAGPTYHQMLHPEQLPPAIRRQALAGSGDELDPINLFNITWRGPGNRIRHIVLPKQLTGVDANIVVLTGRDFPSGSHKVGPAYTTLVAFVAAPRLRAQAYGWSLLFYALGAITLQAGVIGPIINAYGQRWALVALGILVAAGGTVGISTRSFVDADMARAFSGD